MADLSSDLREALARVGTSTLTGVLNRRGLRSMTLYDVWPIRPEQPRMVGLAFTMRFIPSREDKDGPTSTSRSMVQPQAMEECPPGHVLMIDSRGDSRAASAGDLYVVIHLKAHAVFQRDHNDLHCEMPISFTTAALGGDIKIPTLDGYAKIKIPEETQSGKVFRLRGKGIKGVRSSTHGDLMCHVVVETPVNLTARQRELLNELEAINDKDAGRHNPRAKSWMDKVKEFFAD